MSFVRAAVLGLVQGVTEFLPVSSSGHLILVPALFGWKDQGLAFDVGLHVGTLTALLAYFARDWYGMARAMVCDLAARRLAPADWSAPTRLMMLIALGSVPTAAVGLAFAETVEETFRQPWLLAVLLAMVGAIMLFADRKATDSRTLEDLSVRDALLIGFAQACALFPGVSRSGATLTAGLFRQFSRSDAARFAFLLGTPAFIGAALLAALDLAGHSSTDPAQLAIGFASSAIVGFAVIHWLLRFLRTRTLVPFVVYRFGVAAVTLAIAAARVA